VVAIDLGIDTTTPTGELVANIMAAVSRWERQMIGVRTKDGLAVARAQGKRLGSPVLTSPETVARIDKERQGGATLAVIVEGLNRDSVPCARGEAKWYPSTIRAVLTRTKATACVAKAAP
jgi:DNA invertase Pin-like site-specific DNA recombinase